MKKISSHFTDENRIQAEAQKDGERNLPEMGSYTPAPFEQALIANGEREVQSIYQKVSYGIAKLQSAFHSLRGQMDELESRYQTLIETYAVRKRELGRDKAIPFPSKAHWAFILFLGVGEFPLNTVVFRLFGEAEYLTYIMASTLAITIPILGIFIGIHMRQSVRPIVGNLLIGVLTPIVVGVSLYAISLLREVYIVTQVSASATMSQADSSQLVYVLFALNMLVFFAALVSSYFAHDPDEKLDYLHQSLIFLVWKRNSIRSRLYRTGTRLNGQIRNARSQIQQTRSMTAERVALYRQTNMRFRSLLAPPTFRRDPEFPKLNLWNEVSLNGTDEPV